VSRKPQSQRRLFNVTLPKTGLVQILFVSDGRKDWHAMLCKDLAMEPGQIISYYARQWAIEVFFKDAKQMLSMGKGQSNTFDATVNCCILVMIRYLLLKASCWSFRSAISSGFRRLNDVNVIRSRWTYVKELIVRSSDVVCFKIEPDLLFHFFDIIEDTIINQTRLITAKL